jgi:hypothetical protein
MKAVSHHAIETGQVALGGDSLAQQCGDVLAVAQLTHAAMCKQCEGGQIGGRRLPALQLDDQPVIVGMDDCIEDRAVELRFKAQRCRSWPVSASHKAAVTVSRRPACMPDEEVDQRAPGAGGQATRHAHPG